jgi:hypothetical protein
VCICEGLVRQSLVSHNDEVRHIMNHEYAFSWLVLSLTCLNDKQL